MRTGSKAKVRKYYKTYTPKEYKDSMNVADSTRLLALLYPI
jgi:hypothetical protein